MSYPCPSCKTPDICAAAGCAAKRAEPQPSAADRVIPVTSKTRKTASIPVQKY